MFTIAVPDLGLHANISTDLTQPETANSWLLSTTHLSLLLDMRKMCSVNQSLDSKKYLPTCLTYEHRPILTY